MKLFRKSKKRQKSSNEIDNLLESWDQQHETTKSSSVQKQVTKTQKSSTTELQSTSSNDIDEFTSEQKTQLNSQSLENHSNDQIRKESFIAEKLVNASFSAKTETITTNPLLEVANVDTNTSAIDNNAKLKKLIVAPPATIITTPSVQEQHPSIRSNLPNASHDDVKNQGSAILIEDIKKRKLFVIEKRYEKNKLDQIIKTIVHKIWFSYSQIYNNLSYRIITFITVGVILLVIITIILTISLKGYYHSAKDKHPPNYWVYLAEGENFLQTVHNTISFDLALNPSTFLATDVEYIDYKHNSDTDYNFSFYTVFTNLQTGAILNHRFLIKINNNDDYIQVIAGHDYTNDQIFANVDGDWQQCSDDIKTLDTKTPISVPPYWLPDKGSWALFPAKKDLRIVIYSITIVSLVKYEYQFRVDLDLDTILATKKRQFNVAHGILTYDVHHITGYNSDYTWTEVAPY